MGALDSISALPYGVRLVLIAIIVIILLSIFVNNVGSVIRLAIPVVIVYGLWLVLQKLL